MTIEDLKIGEYYHLYYYDDEWTLKLLGFEGDKLLTDGSIAVKDRSLYMEYNSRWGNLNNARDIRLATCAEIVQLEACRAAGKFVELKEIITYEIY